MVQKRYELCVGCQMLIPIHMGQTSPKKAGEASNESSVTVANKATTANKPKRTGSLALFFRKVSTLLITYILNMCIVSVILVIHVSAEVSWFIRCGTVLLQCLEP